MSPTGLKKNSGRAFFWNLNRNGLFWAPLKKYEFDLTVAPPVTFSNVETVWLQKRQNLTKKNFVLASFFLRGFTKTYRMTYFDGFKNRDLGSWKLLVLLVQLLFSIKKLRAWQKLRSKNFFYFLTKIFQNGRKYVEVRDNWRS